MRSLRRLTCCSCLLISLLSFPKISVSWAWVQSSSTLVRDRACPMGKKSSFCSCTWREQGIDKTMSLDIRNTSEAVWGSQYSPMLLYWPRRIGQWSVWLPSIVAWELPLRCSYFYYQTIPYFSMYFLFALFSDEPEVFLPEYSQPAILG